VAGSQHALAAAFVQRRRRPAADLALPGRYDWGIFRLVAWGCSVRRWRRERISLLTLVVMPEVSRSMSWARPSLDMVGDASKVEVRRAGDLVFVGKLRAD
jgi:hypothetical protein